MPLEETDRADFDEVHNQNKKSRVSHMGLLRPLKGFAAIAVCLYSIIGYFKNTSSGGPELIYLLVDSGYIWGFLTATTFAVAMNHISGGSQNVTLSFTALIAVVLWLGNEPYAEPFPGAIAASVLIATVLQTAFGYLAFSERVPNRLHTDVVDRTHKPDQSG